MAIRAKLVIIIFVFAILPMFLLWGLGQSTSINSVTSLLQEDLDSRAQEITEQINSVLARHQAELRDLAHLPSLKAYVRSLARNDQAQPDGPLRMDLGAFLLAHQRQHPALICVNRAGRPIFKIEDGSEPGGGVRAYLQNQNFVGEETGLYPEAFKSAGSDAVPVSEVERDAGGSHVRLAAPLSDEAGNPVAALILRLPTDKLLTEAVGPPAPTTNRAAQAKARWRQAIILDRAGSVLYSSDPAKQGHSYVAAFQNFEPAFTAIRRGALNSHDKYLISHEEWLIRPLKYSGPPELLILVLEKYSDAVSGLEFAGVVMLLLTLALAVVVTLALYYLISRTTDSIRRVTRGAKAIAAGDLDYQIKVKTNDETRVLADAFNRMAARLREMIARESEQKQFESFARLSAVLTHDLKNAILSLSLLVTNMERKFDREGFREDAMRTLSNSVSNLQNLVAKLSDPLAQTKKVRQLEDLSAIVERVLARTAEQAGSHYKITTTLLPRLSATVDPKAIERVIENLVINALEAMPQGGALRIATRVENEAAIIAVADTGKGMSEEFLRERLFHPFATTKKKGIGLGLYSCRDIIEQHNGRIEVTSKTDSGTEFRIVLPLAAEAVKAQEETQVAAV